MWKVDELFGNDNALWSWGREQFEEGRHADLVATIEPRLNPLDKDPDWQAWGNTAQQSVGLVKGMGRVFLALGHLGQDDFVECQKQLIEACQSYHAACESFGPSPESTTAAPLPGFHWPDSELANEPEAFLRTCLNQLDDAWGGKTSAVGMVRSLLSEFYPTLLPSTEGYRKIHLPLLFVQRGEGLVKNLTIECFPGGGGSCQWIFPDPRKLGGTALKKDFLEAIATAWRFAQRWQPQDGEKRDFPQQAWIRWRIEPLESDMDRPDFALEGNSAGAAFAMALCGLKHGMTFDRVAITASVNDKGQFGGVGNVQHKLTATIAFSEADLKLYPGLRVLLCHDDYDKFEYLRQARYQLKPILNVDAALPHLTGVVEEVLEFLKNFSEQVLWDYIKFRPERSSPNSIAGFCQATHVITEDQWHQLRHERALPVDYTTAEELLRLGQGERIIPKNLLPLVGSGRSNQHTVIRGEPGEGKTTALALYVAHRALQLRQSLLDGKMATDSVECRVTLVLPLSKSAIDTKLVAQAARETVRLAFPAQEPSKEFKKWLNERISTKSCDLALDALDELPTGCNFWLTNEMRGFTMARVVITTRASQDPSVLLTEPQNLRMVCFSQRQVRAYVRAYFHDRADLSSQVNDRLRLSPGPRQMARVPLLLALMCDRLKSHPRDPLPTTRTELLQKSIQRLLERGDELRDKSTYGPRTLRNQCKERVLRHVAWRFHGREPYRMERWNLLDELKSNVVLIDEEPPINANSLLTELLQDGVLVPKGPDDYGFILRSLHEYCLAGWIAYESGVAGNSGSSERLISLLYGDDPPKLEFAPRDNIWPLVSGQLGEQAEWLLTHLWDKCWTEDNDGSYATLLGNALYEAPASCPTRQWMTTKLIIAIQDKQLAEWPRMKCSRLLGAVEGHVARVALIDVLQDASAPVDVRMGCAHALGKFGDERARDALIAVLSDEWAPSGVQGASAGALGTIGDEHSRDALIATLQGAHTAEVKHECARSLGAIGDDSSREALCAALENGEMPEWVRRGCAEYLGQIGDEIARGALTAAILDRRKPVMLRQISAFALGMVGDECSRDFLIAVLRDVQTLTGVRDSCAKALGTIGDDRSRDALISAIQDEETPEMVRRDCAWPLGQIGGVPSRDALIAVILDRQTTEAVRNACVRGLSNFDEDRPQEVRSDPVTGDLYDFVPQIGDEQSRALLRHKRSQ